MSDEINCTKCFHPQLIADLAFIRENGLLASSGYDDDARAVRHAELARSHFVGRPTCSDCFGTGIVADLR